MSLFLSWHLLSHPRAGPLGGCRRRIPPYSYVCCCVVVGSPLLRKEGVMAWAVGEGSRGMGGPLMRTPPSPPGGRSRDRRQVRQPVAVQERPRTRQPVRATPHGVALHQHHLPPRSWEARPTALAADGSLPTIAQDSPPGPFSAWAGPDLTVCAFPGVPGPATVATAGRYVLPRPGAPPSRGACPGKS